jgi:hypothetical protein
MSLILAIIVIVIVLTGIQIVQALSRSKMKTNITPIEAVAKPKEKSRIHIQPSEVSRYTYKPLSYYRESRLMLSHFTRPIY